MWVDADRHFSVDGVVDSLAFVKQANDHKTTSYVYGAVAPGNQVFVLTPRDPGPDGCISCVTVHCSSRLNS